MRTEFRNRAFLPVVLPIVILLGMIATIVFFALIMLYNTKVTAIVLAIVMAAGILTAISLLSSQDDPDRQSRVAALGAGAIPVVLGVALALGIGGIPEDALNINREEISVIPPDAAVIAARNSQDFVSDEVTMPAATEVTLVFDNEENGVPHNWALYTADPADGGEAIFNGEVITGPEQIPYTFESPEAGEYFFQCDVHPNMRGVALATEDAEAVEVSEGGEV